MKYSVQMILKTIEKLINAGYKDEKSIQKIDLEELIGKQELTIQEINIIIGLKKAIRSKELIRFMSGEFE